MSASPKAGEVWVGHEPTYEYVIVAGPDACGYYAATNPGGRFVVISVTHLHRKPAAPPSDVECWTNWPGLSAYYCATEAELFAGANRTWRFDAYGNWVPCQGKTVIGPAVKGRP